MTTERKIHFWVAIQIKKIAPFILLMLTTWLYTYAYGLSGVESAISVGTGDNEHIVAVGKKGLVLITESNKNWHQATRATTSDLHGAASMQTADVNSLATVAVGTHGTFLYSENLTEWEHVAKGVTNTHMRAVTWTGKYLVAVGQNSAIFRSSDGKKWEKIALDETFNNAYFYDVAWNGKVLTVIGNYKNAMLQSYDEGASWRAVSGAKEGEFYSFTKVYPHGDAFAVLHTHGALIAELGTPTANAPDHAANNFSDPISPPVTKLLWGADNHRNCHLFTLAENITEQSVPELQNFEVKATFPAFGKLTALGNAKGKTPSIATQEADESWHLEKIHVSSTHKQQKQKKRR